MKNKTSLFIVGLLSVVTAASVFTLVTRQTRNEERNVLTTSIKYAQKCEQNTLLAEETTPTEETTKKKTTKKIWTDLDTAWTVFGVTTGLSAALIGTMVFIRIKKKI